jgi:Fructose-1,6-bisphosphate aldolase
MTRGELETIAQALVADGKGILAADESTGTIGARFASVDVESTFESRRDYREVLFSTPGLGRHISGIIMFDETIRQPSANGIPLVKVPEHQHIRAGIKVDHGTRPLAGFPGEVVTEGLDGLRDRLTEYVELGASFAKWRAVIRIGDGVPSRGGLAANAHALARYAALCQEAGLVPIVEAEVMMEGGHDIETCEEVTTRTLAAVFAALDDQRVLIEAILLRPNMVLPGLDSPHRVRVDEVAERTLRCLRRTVPAAVPGIVFLSGGQSSEDATAHLNAMNKRFGPHPWRLSFSFGRALQEQALKAWRGSKDNWAAAQELLLRRAKFNHAAAKGTFAGEPAPVL